jgi:hypothetical protein
MVVTNSRLFLTNILPSTVKNMFKILEERVCRIDGNRCIVVSKIYVHFTKTCQSSANLTQKLKYTCEHIRYGKKTTQVDHCNWREKISVQVDIIMTIFSKTYSATNGNLSEKMFWTFVHVFTLVESWWKKQYWLSVKCNFFFI